MIIVLRNRNRYSNKRTHKRKMKQRYGRGLYSRYSGNIKLHEDECREEYGGLPNARNGGYEYWQTYYLTGRRSYAKWCTNRAIRAWYRDVLRTAVDEDLDDIQALCGADYEKMFDYDWTVW